MTISYVPYKIKINASVHRLNFGIIILCDQNVFTDYEYTLW